MTELKTIDRIEFLAKKFDVFENNEVAVSEKVKSLKEDEWIVSVIYDDNTGEPLAIYSEKLGGKGGQKTFKCVSTSFNVFSDIVASDPTPNKSCVQWMLTVFTRYIKENTSSSILSAKRFVLEDLPQANEYISLFEANKNKRKFKELCSSSYILKNVSNPLDINQYKSLSQLFDAVDPFILRDPTEMESLLNRYVNANKASVPVKDRRFTVYIPKTNDASIIFHKFANWCTARPENGMFTTYTNYLTPDNKKSKLYIVIDNRFFTGESDDIYQIHFESGQIRDRRNITASNFFEDVISQSEGLSNFFYEELITLAKMVKDGISNNKYLDILIKFGFSESMFEVMDVDTPIIRIMNKEVPKLPDISRFKNLDQLVIIDSKLVKIDPSIGTLNNLEMLVLTNNKIKELPKEIGNLKKLIFINLIGNPIESIPAEISKLDRKNGGSLFRIAVKKEEIGEHNFKRLMELLPSTKFN